MKRDKERNKETIVYGTKLLFPALLLPGLLLAGCGTGGAVAQENPQADAPADTSQTVKPVQPTPDTGNTDSSDSTDKPDNTGESGNTGGGGKAADSGKGLDATDPVLAERTASSLQSTTKKVGGVAVVTNATAQTVIVNKQRSLPKGYKPSDLVEPDVPFSFEGPHEKRHMRKEAAGALEELFAAAKKDGIKLRAVSGYRSYARQKTIYNNNVKTKGLEYASRVSAVPGMSEHQTGLAIDVSSPSVGNALEESFGSSKEGKWLAKHAPEYGFVIRYPKGQEAITGYVYEPWHIRYIGPDLAKDAASKGLTLEEYFDEDHIKL
ncbi:M15 family metallopeptidase [Paenibacillus sp. P96]|uniref:M15 family metallopeptidase n=1 Tax=Paenibacillus zeirhizosphaerae TaxID=2987519 RepID=A0ABT9FV24_9BACL|nr:M15 family metallopeptidase [Paenibacillus sp. P96]MDP4098550.1 M15 family metallopeptidase [Paenibacillus sp. P96]